MNNRRLLDNVPTAPNLRPTLLNFALLTSEPPNRCLEVHDVHGRNETRSSYLKNMFNRHWLPEFRLEVVDLLA
jgi:hypothetical protein